MSEEIRLKLADWLYNAGIVGMVNILEHAGDDVNYEGREVSFSLEVLENFQEKYFNYFIDTYEKTMIYTRVIEKIDKLLTIEINKSNEEKIKDDIKYIKDKMINSAYKNIVETEDLKFTDAKMNINYDKLNQLKNKIAKNKIQILKTECIGYYDQKLKKSKSPNAIIDKYINTNMLDIFNLVLQIKDYYISDKSRYKFNCFTCGNSISKIEGGLSFLNRMFFDTSRKTSHVWNFESDIEICPICKLVYYSVPAGFTTIFGKGMYINTNSSIENAVSINKNARYEILKEIDKNESYSTFRVLTNALYRDLNDNNKYEIADIQVVRYENEKYRFNLLSKNILKILYNIKDRLNNLLNANYEEGNIKFNLHEEIITKLLNNEKLYSLIQKLLILKLGEYEKLYYNTSHIKSIIEVNYNFMKEVLKLDNLESNIIESASGAGWHLKNAYKNKNAENKLDGIAYRLLNALKTNNQSMFMDTVLNCYLYTNKTVPMFFTDCMKDENIFKTIGYSFVSGLIDGEEYKKINKGGVING